MFVFEKIFVIQTTPFICLKDISCFHIALSKIYKVTHNSSEPCMVNSYSKVEFKNNIQT